MKKVISIMAIAMVLAAPAAMAQKINESAVRAKMEKSEAEINDAKKAEKAATWLNRAKIYSDAITEPTKSLFVGLDATMLRIAMGEPDERCKRLGLSLGKGIHQRQQGKRLGTNEGDRPECIRDCQECVFEGIRTRPENRS